jgi:phospholipase/carboxylesterase
MQLEPKKVGFNWLTIYEKERSINDFLGYMKRLVDRLCQDEAIDRSRIFVLGFSQGGAMAYRLAVSGAVPIRGAIICGGDLPADVRGALSSTEPFPILLVHGDNDPLVDVSMAEEAETALRGSGFHPDRFRYDQGHTIPDAAVRAIGEWIVRHGW